MTKSKNKKNNNNKNKKQAKSSGKQRKISRPGVPMALVSAVCGITDPFCSASWGAKFPDGRSSKSMALPFRVRSSLTTDSSGNVAVLFTPVYSNMYASLVMLFLLVATYTTYGGGLIPSYAAATIAGYRINSMGLRLKNIVTPMTAGGIVRIRGFGAKYGTSFGSVDYSTYNYDYGEDIPLQDCKDVCVVLRKLDDTAEFFTNPATTTPTSSVTDWVSPGWGAVSILVTGAAASLGVIDYELYINYEIVFVDSDTNALIMTKARPQNTLLTQASAAVTNAMNPVIERGIKAVEKTIADKAFGFLARAVGAAAGYAMGGAQGAIAGAQGGGLLADGTMMVD